MNRVVSPHGGLGIDVGQYRLHIVEIAADGTLGRAEVWDANHRDGLVEWARRVGYVAIDAPSAPGGVPQPHTGMAAKFTGARCAEIALGQNWGMWVPWATPVEGKAPRWMQVGFGLFRQLAALGSAATVVETYPHAVFLALLPAAERLESKRSASGTAQRAQLLEQAGLDIPWLSMWSHDGLDAAAAALVARAIGTEYARSVTCHPDRSHDGSSIWLLDPVGLGVPTPRGPARTGSAGQESPRSGRERPSRHHQPQVGAPGPWMGRAPGATGAR